MAGDFSEQPHAERRLPMPVAHSGLPAFAYWVDCANEATFWVTAAADYEYQLGAHGPVEENSPVGVYALTPADQTYLRRKPNINITLIGEDEAPQLLAGLAPNQGFSMDPRLMHLGIVSAGRIDEIIKLPPALKNPETTSHFLTIIDREIFRSSWTEQFLKTNPIAVDPARLLAHILVDSVFMAVESSLLQHAEQLVEADWLQTNNVDQIQAHILERSLRIGRSLHATFCNQDHRPVMASV